MKNKPLRILKPARLLPVMGMELEAVKKIHRLPCTACGKLPMLYRLKIAVGSGRSAMTTVLCRKCAEDFTFFTGQLFAQVSDWLSQAKLPPQQPRLLFRQTLEPYLKKVDKKKPKG